MKLRITLLLCVLLFWGIAAGCAQKNVDYEPQSVVNNEPARSLSIEEQRREAYEILKEILLLSDHPERQRNLQEIKSLYWQIIDRYPDLALAQESYMRLVLLAKKENTPEGEAEARKVYLEFLEKYPDSRLQRIMENELKK